MEILQFAGGVVEIKIMAMFAQTLMFGLVHQ